ncbi:hypothetical protein ACFU44_10340 [Nocardia rhizosphaerihabitans]|uniref:hypothetical protein n=1 Tax=Nocardia rhizosphaerihabitans TaxID=1691570 RepID=UPI00366A5CF0
MIVGRGELHSPAQAFVDGVQDGVDRYPVVRPARGGHRELVCLLRDVVAVEDPAGDVHADPGHRGVLARGRVDRPGPVGRGVVDMADEPARAGAQVAHRREIGGWSRWMVIVDSSSFAVCTTVG